MAKGNLKRYFKKGLLLGAGYFVTSLILSSTLGTVLTDDHVSFSTTPNRALTIGLYVITILIFGWLVDMINKNKWANK